MSTRTGDVLTPVLLASVGRATLDPRQAAAEAIAAYLLSLHFCKWNGADLESPASSFQLRNVQREWPEPNQPLAYPCASIIDLGMSSYEAANLVPVCLENTVDRHGPGTVLWRLSELTADFQVDFFSDDKPTRESIAAALPSAFSPGETYGVELACSERYYRTSARATLIASLREDDSGTAYVRERRLRTTIRVQIAVLDLRRAARSEFLAPVDVYSEFPPTDKEC